MDFDSIQDFRSNFANIYHKSVVPMLKPFEKKKKNVMYRSIAVWILLILAGVIYLYVNMPLLKQTRNADVMMCFIMIVIVIIIVGYAITSWQCKSFENKLKEKIMPSIMKAFGNFIWTSTGTIDSYTIKDSNLFTRFETKKDDDCFSGTYKGLEIKINETELTYTTRDSKGNRHTHTEFKGVIAQIDVKKTFKGHTIIRKRSLLNTCSYQEIKLEDPEFSRMYFVDGNDQVESRYILTTSFMERFKNIKNAFRASQMEASLKNNKILIAISTNKDLFKLGDITKPINDTKQFTELLNEFISILSIVDELKLNQNVGL